MRSLKELGDEISLAKSKYDHEALVALANELDDVDTDNARALAFNALGTAANMRHENKLALEYYYQALELYRQLGKEGGVADILNQIGSAYMDIGDYPAALENYLRSVAVSEEINSKRKIMYALSNAGNVLVRTGDYSTSLEYMHKALDLNIEIGDEKSLAKQYGNIGVIYANTGDHDSALEYYQRALDLNEVHDDRYGVAIVNSSIGILHYQNGDHELARTFFKRAIDIFQEFGDNDAVASNYVNVMGTYLAQSDQANATDVLTKIDRGHIEDPTSIMILDANRAELHVIRKELDAAAAVLLDAIQKAQDFGMPRQKADMHKSMRELALLRNDLASYVEHNNAYNTIIEEINGKATASRIAMQEAERRISAERREHERHLAVLHSTLPKHIVERVARGEIVNDHYDQAAVMFVDIVGFTTLSSSLTSQQVISILDAVFKVCDEACGSNNVTRIKTIGDSYLAVSMPDAERQMPDKMPDAERQIPNLNAAIANAALEIIESIKAMDFQSLLSLPVPSISTSDSERLQVRIGLHCGPVTAGVLGTERLQYDVWGDTVNVASRMESTSEPNKIHVTEQFALSLRDVPSAKFQVPKGVETAAMEPGTWNMALIERGAIDVKGKGKMNTFWLEPPHEP